MRPLPKDPTLGWTPYAWLIYLPMSIVPPLLGRHDPAAIVVSTILAAAFLVLYFRAWWVRGRALIWVIAGMAGLGAVGAHWNPGALVFFVYAATFVGEVDSPRRAYLWLGALIAIMLLAVAVLRLDPRFALPALAFSAMLGAVLIHYSEQRRIERGLQRAREDVEYLARVAERERIASDLHDVLGHTLTVIVLRAEVAARLAESEPERARSEMQDVGGIARGALAEVRHAILGMRTVGLDREIEQVTRALETAGVQVKSTGTIPGLPAAHETVLSLVLREAATNIIRHAAARHCRLHLVSSEGACGLEIADDGCGYGGREGAGLRGMRDRIRTIGGMLELRDEAGTTLVVRLPLPSAGSTA